MAAKSIMKQNSQMYEIDEDKDKVDGEKEGKKKNHEMTITWNETKQGNVQIDIAMPGWDTDSNTGARSRRISRHEKLKSRMIPYSMRIDVSTADMTMTAEAVENELCESDSNRRMSHIDRLKQRKMKGHREHGEDESRKKSLKSEEK